MVCLVYNFAQHYRANIFTLMDQQLDIDFYFGDHYLNVKKMDYNLLKHKVTEVKNLHFGPIMWQQNIAGLAFKPYKKYIMLGEPMCLSTWLLLIFGRLLGKEMYFWTHGWYGKETWIKKVIKKAFFGLATGTMTYGNYARYLMIKEGLNGDKIVAIHNSLMYDEQLPIRQSLKKTTLFSDHFGNELPTVIFIGRLTTVKKLDQLLEAQAICKKNGFTFNVAFIGDGTEKEPLLAKTKALGVEDNVWFYGPSYDEKELSQILYNADLCVAPGNIGLTAMHAMVYGCPCISHNDFPWQMPEFEAIQEGKTGGFFERYNVVSLAQAIKQWFEEHQNEREEIRQNCFKEIDENWNPHKQLDIIKSFTRL